jgi:NitT/TauT family transport system ATP-binding protein
VLFVTHSIPEAVRVGNRILLLSPHPGQVRAELNSSGKDDLPGGAKLSQRISQMLFAEEVEQEATFDA